MRLTHFAEALASDVRYAIRQAGHSRGMATVIIASLALGIGANTALFTVVNSVMLRGVAVTRPDRLVGFRWVATNDTPRTIMGGQSGRSTRDAAGRWVGFSFPYPSYTYIRAHLRTLSQLAGFVSLGMLDRPSAVVRGTPMFVDGEMVTGNYFDAVGVMPALGRAISPGDEHPAAPRVAVISDRFWTRAFDRDTSVIGTTITVNTVPVTIVGVAPAGFVGLEAGRSPDVWVPITMQPGLTPWGGTTPNPQTAYVRPNYWWLQLFGRVKPGVAREQAQREFSGLLKTSFAGSVPEALLAKAPAAEAIPAATAYSRFTARLAKPLYVLGGVVVLVLLVACANVATLLLARATARRKEMSVRLALGASRVSLFRQLLTEHALYAAVGGAAGLLVASWSGRLLLALLSPGPEPLSIDVGFDWRVLAFTAGATALTTILFGVAPAVRATRVEAASGLKDRTAGSPREMRLGRFRLGRVFVAFQIAMTVPLVIGAGLFLRTLANLQHEELGFNSENVLVFTLDPTNAGLKGAAAMQAYEEMREAMERLPGVKCASYSLMSLISDWHNNGTVTTQGAPATNSDTGGKQAYWNAVGPGFFDAMGMRLLVGRPIDRRDVAGAPKIAVINQSMARKFFGTREAVGRRFWPGAQGTIADAVMVVGVVADAKYSTVRAPAPPTYFLAAAQGRVPTSMSFEIRTTGDPMAVVGTARQIAGRIAPGVPLGNIKTQAMQIAESLRQERMLASLSTAFGTIAIALACIGLHGTMAYALRRRTREIGIRLALGAARRSIVRTAVGESAAIALIGIVAGGGLAAGGARFVSSLMFGITPLNPTMIAGAAGLMLTVALVAGYIPARRVSRVDPMEALRDE